MAAQTQQSSLAKRLGKKLDDAVKKNAHNPIKQGIVQLPPGIKNGIARLSFCGFGIYQSGPNQGKDYYRATGVILSPASVVHNGVVVPIQGLTTTVMIPLCETKGLNKTTSFEENLDKAMNEMKLLGADPDAFEAGGAAFEQIAKDLMEAAPTFRFSTSLRKAMKEGEEDGVWENWHGAVSVERVSADPGAGVQDDGAVSVEPSQNGHAALPEAAAEESPENSDQQAGYSDSADLDSLAAAADAGDRTAMQKLEEFATTSGGMTQEQANAFNTWAELVEALKSGATETPAEEPAEPQPPVKDQVVGYVVLDKAGKPVLGKDKKPKAAAQCKVLAVYTKTQKADLVDATTKAVYKNVPWDQLLPSE